MKRYRYSVLLAAIALCALSCVSEPMYETGLANTDVLTFSVSTARWGDTVSVATADVQSSLQESFPVAALSGTEMQLERSLEAPGNDPATRAVQKTDLASPDEFSVVCYVNNEVSAGASFDQDNCRLYFPVRSVSYDSGLSKWQAAGGENDTWMPASNLRFCAWWPQAALGSDPQTFAYNQTTKQLSFQLDKPYDGEITLSPAGGVYAAEAQRDLLVSVSDSGNNISADQALSFKHALTAVQFCTTNNLSLMQGDNVTIKRITIKNVAYKGVLDLMAAATDAATIPEQAWTVEVNGVADLADFTVRPSLTTPTSGVETLNAGDMTFFMLPQSLESEVNGYPKEVEIEFVKGSETSVFSASLGGLPAWKPGQTVRYLLGQRSGDAYIIFADPIAASPTATKGTLSVYSYRITPTNAVFRVPFNVTGVSIDGGRTWNDIGALQWTGRNQNPTDRWIENLGEVHNQNPSAYDNTPRNYVLNFTPHGFTGTVSRMDEIDAMLQAEPAVVDRDLSLYDAKGEPIPGGRCTANCYVVSGAGSYKFPTVYGNAILNGADQLDQCSLPSFRNFNMDGQDAPSSPWINRDIYHQQAGTIEKPIVPVRAVVLWQQSCYYTEPNPMQAPVWVTNTQLIDPNSVSYYLGGEHGDEGMISFQTCPSADMHQGNAVIALLDADDTVLWSWHIWFTSVMRYLEGSTPDAPIPFSDVNIGNGLLWTRENLGTIYWGMMHSYTSRGVVLRLQQTDLDLNVIPDGSTAKVQVTQRAGYGSDYRVVQNVMYQFGNKNPYPVTTPEYSSNSVLQNLSNRHYSGFISEQLNGMDGVMSDIAYTTESRTLQETVRRPWMMAWRYGASTNNWSIKTEGLTAATHFDTQKTIYDPNPYPYSIGAYFRDFSSSYGITIEGAIDKGVTVYGNGQELYFPFTGQIGNYILSGVRHMTKTVSGVKNYNIIWTSKITLNTSSSYTGYSFYFNDQETVFYRTYGNSEPRGFSVRPSRLP